MRLCIFVISILLLFSSSAFALKCDKCHKDEKSLQNIFADRGVKSKAELFNILRNGKMSKIHKNINDEEINEAAKFMNLK